MIEGEGAVNIIQQKTAVRALVEVRDRNNLPVSGAAVTFKVAGQGGAALTGGSPTITVTTNAAGRAALSGGLTPTAPGTVHISVSAGYQGLTATTEIAQAVVATAAQAAAIGAAAAGGAAAGGGGIGTGAIVGIVAGGAAVAAGAVAGAGLRAPNRCRTPDERQR